MPPSVKISKERIVDAAMELVRQGGANSLNARALAELLGCSTQPIFSNFATMDALRAALTERAIALYHGFAQTELASCAYPAYKANGMAYIRFAKDEPELFKLLFMCQRTPDSMQQDSPLFAEMQALLHNTLGLSQDHARRMHLQMWIYVHGIATMFATGFLDLEQDLISQMLSEVYLSIKKNYEKE